ncbi:MAG TPA: alpha-N-acetylglucosaminidase N-terminal domain-containing protein [Terriglobia bacterium]|nr:alpha-N-acetylglucosaminidase N-terminal domain-containing protein [Terriglobia bacterium]
MKIMGEEVRSRFQKELPATDKKGASPNIRRRDFLSNVLAGILVTDSSRSFEGSRNNSQVTAENTAITELAVRVLGARAESLTFESIEDTTGLDVFEIEAVADRLILRGNNPVSQAHGLNHYLREFCNAQVSWTGDQLNLPRLWPEVTGKVRKGSPYPYRYYLNYAPTVIRWPSGTGSAGNMKLIGWR